MQSTTKCLPKTPAVGKKIDKPRGIYENHGQRIPWGPTCLGLTLVCILVMSIDTVSILTLAANLTSATHGLQGFPTTEAMEQFSMENPRISVNFAGAFELRAFGALLWIRVLFNTIWLVFLMKIVAVWNKKTLGLVCANILLSMVHLLLTLVLLLCKNSSVKNQNIVIFQDFLDLIFSTHFAPVYVIMSALLYTKKENPQGYKLSVVIVPTNYMRVSKETEKQ